MQWLGPSIGLGDRLPSLLLTFLALLGIAWAELQQPQLQEKPAPVPGGKQVPVGGVWLC